MTKVTPDEFKQENLQAGRLYKIHARNFSFGVYDGNGGFISIREKFGSLYLFTEYHWDPPWGGTVTPYEATEHVVPEEIELKEYFPNRCNVCEGLTEFVPDQPDKPTPGRQHHVDRAVDADHDPHRHTYVPMNGPLFAWLKPFDDEANRLWQIERDQAELDAESRRWAPQEEWQYLYEKAVAEVHAWRREQRDLITDRDAERAIHDEYVERLMQVSKNIPKRVK